MAIDPKQFAAAIEAKLAAVETEITAINEALEDQRRAVKERLAPLLAQRDHLADALKAVRANLTHLIPPQTIAALGIESGAAVGTPGSGS